MSDFKLFYKYTCLSILGHFLWSHLLYAGARLEQTLNGPKKLQGVTMFDLVDPEPPHSVK